MSSTGTDNDKVVILRLIRSKLLKMNAYLFKPKLINFRFSGLCKKLDLVNGTRMHTPFIQIHCSNDLGAKAALEYEAIVLPPEEMSNKTKLKTAVWEKFELEKPPSILVIGNLFGTFFLYVLKQELMSFLVKKLSVCFPLPVIHP